jgi:hypothetical protein
MNVFEILFVLLWIGFGLAGADWASHRFGTAGSILGFVVGMGVTYGAYLGIGRAVRYWLPDMPPCVCGRSGPQTYQFEAWSVGADGATQ